MQSFYQIYNESRKYRGTSWVVVFRKTPDLEVLIGSKTEDSKTKVLPGGRLDKGESGKDAALRELEEETGIHVEEDIFYVDVKPKKYRSIQETALAIWSEIQKVGKAHA